MFDRILIESLPASFKVYYATRHTPIINDVMLEDAINTGVDKCANILSSGCNTPGTVLSKCSVEFLEIFNHTDIVISKGQGNYEGFDGYNRKIYFLLKAKCNMIAKG